MLFCPQSAAKHLASYTWGLFWVVFSACDAKPPSTALRLAGAMNVLNFRVTCFQSERQSSYFFLLMLLVVMGGRWSLCDCWWPCRPRSHTSRKKPYTEALEPSCLGLMPNQPLVNVQRPAFRVKAQFGHTLKIHFCSRCPRCQVALST